MSSRLKILNIVGARPNPEGTNLLVGTDPAKIVAAVGDTLAGKSKAGRVPPEWDAQAAKRIVEILLTVVPRGNAA